MRAIREVAYMQPLVLATLALFALCEMGLAVCCLRRYPHCRVPALALLLSAPLQVLSALYAGRLLAAWHAPSSSDPLGPAHR